MPTLPTINTTSVDVETIAGEPVTTIAGEQVCALHISPFVSNRAPLSSDNGFAGDLWWFEATTEIKVYQLQSTTWSGGATWTHLKTLNRGSGRMDTKFTNGTLLISNYTPAQGDPRLDQSGRCWLLDGVGDSVSVTAIPEPSYPFGMACWFKTTQAGDGVLVAYSDQISHWQSIGLSNGVVDCLRGDGVNSSAGQASSGLNDDAWHHLAVNFLNSTQISIYVDGSFVSTVVQATTDLTGLNAIIAGTYRVATPPRLYTGYIKDIRVINNSFTAPEIAKMAAMLPGSQDIGTLGNVLHWHCEESDGDANNNTVAPDASGNGYDGTINNNSALTAFHDDSVNDFWSDANERGHSIGTGSNGYAAGVIIPRVMATEFDAGGNALDYIKQNRAMKLTTKCVTFGSADYVLLKTTKTLTCNASSKWSLSYWANSTLGFGNTSISDIGATSVIFHSTSSSQIHISLNDGKNLVFPLPSATASVDTHILITYDGTRASDHTRFKVYVDGTLLGYTSQTYVGAATSFKFDNFGQFWEGTLWGVNVWSTAEDANANKIYRGSRIGTDNSWPVEESAGDTVHDVVGLNHGKLIGSGWAWSGTQSKTESLVKSGAAQSTRFNSTDYLSKATRVTSGAMTLLNGAAWVNISTTTGAKIIMSEDPGGTDRIFLWYVDLDRITLSVWDPSQTLLNVRGNTIINRDRWYHMAFTYNAGTIVLYLNGAVEPFTVIASGTVNSLKNGTTPFSIGSHQGGSNTFQGMLSHVVLEQDSAWGSYEVNLCKDGRPPTTAWYWKGGNEVESFQSLADLTINGTLEDVLVPAGIVPVSLGPKKQLYTHVLTAQNANSPFWRRMAAVNSNLLTYSLGDGNLESSGNLYRAVKLTDDADARLALIYDGADLTAAERAVIEGWTA